MRPTNKNSPFDYRLLRADEFSVIHKTFVAGFADYIIQFELSERQFQNHITLNNVDLDRSAGCFDAERPVGLSLNGFGMWEGKSTVYDAGTTVIPEYRRRGISRTMFDWMIPAFTAEGYKQFLLEVITNNDPAVRLYELLGFRKTRELLLLECEPEISLERPAPADVEIREIHRHENIPYTSFWDGKPSWQNSPDAIQRSVRMKRLIGAFIGDTCVGYIVFAAGVGRLAQLAVHRDHRRKGIATRLMREMQKDAPGQKLHVINLDEGMTESVVFFQNLGFRKVLAQFEMLREL
ncbi:MAG TPA: GNAT family N-acetyltransferase [Pyrinomonadaceae bacterium]|nr:GNAT family N-acetyltransferase [Pyrinomonadaceae bacterium]